MAKNFKSMDELFSHEVRHESYVRALTDDFSVVDIIESADANTPSDDDDVIPTKNANNDDNTEVEEG